jgi:hypothetical protein
MKPKLTQVLRIFKKRPKFSSGSILMEPFYKVPGWGSVFRPSEIKRASEIWDNLIPEELPRAAVTGPDSARYSPVPSVEYLIVGAARHYLAGMPPHIDEP